MNLSVPKNLPRLLAITLAVAILPRIALSQTLSVAETPAQVHLDEQAGRRFPQPVRVGDLPGRKLLAPHENQPVLGWVRAIVRGTDGHTNLVVRLAGWFWERERDVAIPIEAIGILGEHVALLDIPSERLRELRVFDPATDIEVGQDQSIRIGLAKPFH